MRIAICDDEEPQRLLLKRHMEEWARRNKAILSSCEYGCYSCIITLCG